MPAWGTPYLFGPGSIHVAHRDDEHVSLERIARCGAQLRTPRRAIAEVALFARRLCEQELAGKRTRVRLCEPDRGDCASDRRRRSARRSQRGPNQERREGHDQTLTDHARRARNRRGVLGRSTTPPSEAIQSSLAPGGALRSITGVPRAGHYIVVFQGQRDRRTGAREGDRRGARRQARVHVQSRAARLRGHALARRDRHAQVPPRHRAHRARSDRQSRHDAEQRDVGARSAGPGEPSARCAATRTTPAAAAFTRTSSTAASARHTSSSAGARTGVFTSVSDGNGTSDCNGHGTHVAGTLGGDDVRRGEGGEAASRCACSIAAAAARSRASSPASTT